MSAKRGADLAQGERIPTQLARKKKALDPVSMNRGQESRHGLRRASMLAAVDARIGKALPIDRIGKVDANVSCGSTRIVRLVRISTPESPPTTRNTQAPQNPSHSVRHNGWTRALRQQGYRFTPCATVIG